MYNIYTNGNRCWVRVLYSVVTCEPIIEAFYACMDMALIFFIVWYARSQDSLLSVSLLIVHAAFPTIGFKGGRKPRPKRRETATLRRGIQKASCTYLAGFEPMPLVQESFIQRTGTFLRISASSKP